MNRPKIDRSIDINLSERILNIRNYNETKKKREKKETETCEDR